MNFIYMVYSETVRFSVLSIIASLACGAAFLATPAAAAVSCDFTRDLDVGIDGEDVRCLQRYLNDAGFTIATDGVGSPGNETSLFRDLTKEAVIRWQTANDLTPAIGYFGPASRAKYSELAASGQIGATPSPVVLGVSTSAPTTPTPTPSPASVQNEIHTKTLELFGEVLEKFNEARGAVSDDDNEDAQDALDKAYQRFFLAVENLIAEEYSRAVSYAESAIEEADEAIDESAASGDKEEAEKAIDRAQQEIEEVEESLEEAQEDGDDTDEAEELLEEAEDALDDAEDALDDGEYEDALEAAQEALDVARDAEDEIGNGGGDDEDEAEELIEEAQNRIDEAWDKLEEAEDNGDDVTAAEELLDEAEDALNDAEDAFDEEEWEDAIEDAEEAIELAEDAEDAL